MTLNWNNATWLAVRQMRDNWAAYGYTAVYFVIMGLALAKETSWAAEFAILVLMLILIQPTLSSRYMTMKPDNEVSRHQVFLHSLPISFDTIVAARLLAMLVAGAINVPIFFVPFWYIGPGWGSFGIYLAWCAFWVGIALAGTALALVQEFWLSMRTWTILNATSVIVLIVVLLLVILIGDVRPYAQSIELANESPWLMAAIGPVIGLLALWQGVVWAAKGFRRREFTA